MPDANMIMYQMQDVILGIVLVVTFVTAAVGFISYRRTGLRKILLVDLGLIIFFLKALFISAVIYAGNSPIGSDSAWFFDVILLMDAGAAVFIYFSITR